MPFTRRPFALATLAVAAMLAAACNEPLSDPVITIEPQNKTASVGQTVQYTATVVEGSDKTVSERPPAWFASNSAVATITSPAGLATARAVGTTSIQVTFQDAAGLFHTKSTTLTVVAAGTVIANGKSDGVVLVLGGTQPIQHRGP